MDSLLGWPAVARKFRNKFERNNRVAFRSGLALAKQNAGENFASRASTREIYENPFCFYPFPLPHDFLRVSWNVEAENFVLPQSHSCLLS
jgi:hypothetical protein